jgi:hypothetical protein
MTAAMLTTALPETALAHTDHNGHDMGAMSSTSDSASAAYKAAMDKMHAAMAAQQMPAKPTSISCAA